MERFEEIHSFDISNFSPVKDHINHIYDLFHCEDEYNGHDAISSNTQDAEAPASGVFGTDFQAFHMVHI